MKRTLLIAATAIALSATAVPHAHAACGFYGKEPPLHHWETLLAKFRGPNAHVSDADRAEMSAIIAAAELCENDKITRRGFLARIDEAIARHAARTEARDAEPRGLTCDPDGLGGMTCDED